MTCKEERPWGWFEILFEEENLKVKRILVKPKNRLSLQSHKNRSENWVIIQGNAIVDCGENKIAVSQNQGVFIPKNTKHRIENREETDLIFIEVQTGTYLGEDDIIRYEDDFNRI